MNEGTSRLGPEPIRAVIDATREFTASPEVK
jgi:hypothetical protein